MSSTPIKTLFSFTSGMIGRPTHAGDACRHAYATSCFKVCIMFAKLTNGKSSTARNYTAILWGILDFPHAYKRVDRMILRGSPQEYASTPESCFVYGGCVPCSGNKRKEQKEKWKKAWLGFLTEAFTENLHSWSASSCYMADTTQNTSLLLGLFLK